MTDPCAAIKRRWAKRLSWDRDDALQEAAIAQWQCEQVGRSVAYTRMRARGAILDYLSRQRSFDRGLRFEHLEYDDDIGGAPAPEHLSDVIRLLRSRLPARDWRALSEHYLWGESQADIALKRGVTSSAVCQQLRKSLARARRVIR